MEVKGVEKICLDIQLELLEQLREDMKEKCRDVNPMSINFNHINDVFNKRRREIQNGRN